MTYSVGHTGKLGIDLREFKMGTMWCKSMTENTTRSLSKLSSARTVDSFKFRNTSGAVNVTRHDGMRLCQATGNLQTMFPVNPVGSVIKERVHPVVQSTKGSSIRFVGVGRVGARRTLCHPRLF